MDAEDEGGIGGEGWEQRRPVVPMPGTTWSGVAMPVAKSGVQEERARGPLSQETKVFRNHHLINLD